jgi:hypothetical protein
MILLFMIIYHNLKFILLEILQKKINSVTDTYMHLK